MVMHWLKSRKEENVDHPQYQRDFDLSPQGDHYMFWEYLEVGKYQLCCYKEKITDRKPISLAFLQFYSSRRALLAN